MWNASGRSWWGELRVNVIKIHGRKLSKNY